MSFESFLTKIAQIRRLSEIAGTKRTSYQVVASVSCMIQPVSREEASIVGGVFGKTFRLYCKIDADIKDTDKITIAGQDYLVKGVTTFDFGLNPHKVIIVQQVIE